MNISQLKPVSQLAQRFGVKAMIYGGPGSGKTPLIKTCPRPVMLVCEPGLLTMRDANVPAWDAYTPERIDEFFEWLTRSPEAKGFDTVAIDSVSEMAEIFLRQELVRNKDGRKAYGEMFRHIADHLNALYYMPEKHTYLIAKQAIVEDGAGTIKKPYFPGKELNVRVPHMYDEVWHIGLNNIPQAGPKPVLAIRTQSDFNTFARDRSGRLDELEPPHVGNLFLKAMS